MAATIITTMVVITTSVVKNVAGGNSGKIKIVVKNATSVVIAVINAPCLCSTKQYAENIFGMLFFLA